MTSPGLLKHHLADLRASGLNDETIRISGCYSERDPDRLARLINWEHPAKGFGSGLVFVFRDLDGNPTSYVRVKPTNPRTVDGKPAKYESPVGQPNRPYFPPLAIAAVNNRTPILFTEGEKKGLAGDQAGHATIALTGAWGWVRSDPPREEGEALDLHPDLKRFDWKGRRVYICLDSDALYKPNIRAAEWELARILTGLGAEVRIVRLPQKLGGPKVGLDDFLAAAGPAAFDRLLAQARPPSAPTFGLSNTLAVHNPEKPAEPVKLPRSAADMAGELVGRAGGWPKRVGGSLVVPAGGGRVRELTTHQQLLAYAGTVFDAGGVGRVAFDKGPAHVTPQVLLEYLKAECEAFDRVEEFPHVPPLPKVLYLNPPPAVDPTGQFKTLKAFLGFFSPATKDDGRLLLASLATLVWGGPPGSRPAFVYEGVEGDTGAGRGSGKSSTAQKLTAPFGRAFDIGENESFERLRGRLLTDGAHLHRVLLMDNIKSFRLSSQQLESLVTNPFINGHKYFHGQAGIPNYFTMFMTLNGASMSKDFAQRSIPVRVDRRKHRAGWSEEVDAFIAANRTALIADLVGLMRRPPAKLAKFTRWQAWEAQVLARCGTAEECHRCMDLIAERTGHMDADDDDADRIRERFRQVVKEKFRTDPDTARLLLRSSAVTQLVNTALNVRYTAGQASSQLKALGMPDLKQSPRKGQRLWLWTGAAVKDFGGISTPAHVTYNPESEQWGIEGSGDQDEDEIPA